MVLSGAMTSAVVDLSVDDVITVVGPPLHCGSLSTATALVVFAGEMSNTAEHSSEIKAAQNNQ